MKRREDAEILHNRIDRIGYAGRIEIIILTPKAILHIML